MINDDILDDKDNLEEELQALQKEKVLRNGILTSQKDKIIREISEIGDLDTFLTVKKRKKSFWQKLLSVFK